MESNLITPTCEKFRTFFLSYIEFCEGNACAAGLIDVFDKFHTVKLEQRKHNKKYNDVAEQHGDARSQSENLLQPHTLENLSEYLLGMFSLNVVRSALKLLQDKGVITVHSNPNPRYKFDKRAHYLFCPHVYNEWLANNNKIKANSGTFKPTGRRIGSDASKALNQNADLSDLIDRSIKSDAPSIRSDRAIDNIDINIENNNLKPNLVSEFDKLNEVEEGKPEGKVEGSFFDFIENIKPTMETLGEIGEEFTRPQTEFLNAWFHHAKQSPSYVMSDPNGVFEEVKFQLLDKTQYQGCENNFYRKLSAIDATLRKGQWQTPYKLRENNFAQRSKNAKDNKLDEGALLKKKLLALTQEMNGLIAQIEGDKVLCGHLIASSREEHEEAILLIQQQNQCCVGALKKLAEEKIELEKRLNTLKCEGKRNG